MQWRRHSTSATSPERSCCGSVSARISGIVGGNFRDLLILLLHIDMIHMRQNGAGSVTGTSTALSKHRLPCTDVKGKEYVLDMFPYPSAAGLHVEHPLGYTASDAMARYWRHMGYDVLHPMGWDAFGLPAEQHAIATGEHPASSTARNINSFRRQLQSLGFSYDWDRELATTDTEYVRWTQWIFARLVERGLAVQRRSTVNWCAALGTVLANEEVMALPPDHTGRTTGDSGRLAPVVGVSERGGHDVTRVELRQWQLRITEYASRLDEELTLLPNIAAKYQRV